MPRSPEGALAKMPRLEQFKKESSKRREKFEESRLQTPEELVRSLSKDAPVYENGPASLPEADMTIPNAFLLWEKVTRALQENPSASTMLGETKYGYIKDKASAYCLLATEILREQRQLENLDRSDPDYSKKFMSFWEKKSRFVNFSNTLGINFLNYVKEDGLNPENLSEENAKTEGRKANENLPSAKEIIRELSRHVDDRGDAYNKYLFMVNNYAKAAKLGDTDAMTNAERVWKRYDEDLGLNHDMMKTIAFEWVKKEA